MVYASSFVRPTDPTSIALGGRDAENEQVPVRTGRRVRRPDAVLRAVASGVRSRLRDAAHNENIPREAVARSMRRSNRGRGHARKTDPDGDIIELVERGDAHGALRLLRQRHGDTVLRYCREQLRDAALADDIHQQIFIEAFRDLASFQRRATLKFWLLAIARHRILDAVKKRRAAQNYFTQACAAIADAHDLGPSPAESLDEARLLEALVASVGELPDAARNALLLHFLHGLTFGEIASLSSERSGTLCARVTRALPMLRRRIEARLGCAQ